MVVPSMVMLKLRFWSACERPDTWVTLCTGHIANTSSARGGSDALEGVFGDGRKAAVCGSPASRRGDGGTLQRVWDRPQDRLQDLRSLPAMRHSRVNRQEPTSLSLCPSTSVPGGALHPQREARAFQLGRS